MASPTCKAIVTRIDRDKSTMDLKHISVPVLEPHQILVCVASVAQNPTDSTDSTPSTLSDNTNLA